MALCKRVGAPSLHRNWSQKQQQQQRVGTFCSILTGCLGWSFQVPVVTDYCPPDLRIKEENKIEDSFMTVQIFRMEIIGNETENQNWDLDWRRERWCFSMLVEEMTFQRKVSMWYPGFGCLLIISPWKVACWGNVCQCWDVGFIQRLLPWWQLIWPPRERGCHIICTISSKTAPKVDV